MLHLDPRRSRRLLALLLAAAGVTACTDDDASSTTAPASAAPGASSRPSATVAPTPPVATGAPPTAPQAAQTSVPPPTSVIADTHAVGGTSLWDVDPASGTAQALGALAGETVVLGIAAGADGRLHAVTDVPSLLVLDLAALDAVPDEVPVDAGGSTLLALAVRRADGALLAIGDSGAIVRLDAATGVATPVAEHPLADPGVGLDVTSDGALEIVVATGEHVSVDLATGAVTPRPGLVGADGATPRVVALAHDEAGRYGVDASADAIVAIADDGTVTTIARLDVDVTDGASLDVGADGRLVLANPG